MGRKIKTFIKAMRPKHWIKNILIFFPGFFGSAIISVEDLIRLIWGGVFFSLIASGVYFVNDIHDADKDALHPTKCHRPIASGELGRKEACIGAVVLFAAGIWGLFQSSSNYSFAVVCMISVYILSNVMYSIFSWKNIPVMDISLVSSGHIVRIFLGGAISDVHISTWLFVTVLCMSFFMSAEKRRKELERGTEYRDVLEDYSQRYLTVAGIVSMVSGIVFFMLWSMEIAQIRGGVYFPYISTSVGFVGVLLYLYDTETLESGDPVDIILHDKILILLALIFVVVFILKV